MVVVIEARLPLESKFMKSFETVEGEDSLRARKCGWEPPLTEQLVPRG